MPKSMPENSVKISIENCLISPICKFGVPDFAIKLKTEFIDWSKIFGFYYSRMYRNDKYR